MQIPLPNNFCFSPLKDLVLVMVLTPSPKLILILTNLIVINPTVSLAVRLSSKGFACRDRCVYSHSNEAYSCHYKYLSSWNTLHPVKLSETALSLSNDNCSPSDGRDYKNRPCSGPCGFHGQTSYQWCHVNVNNDTTWGYCSIQNHHPGTHMADFKYRGETCENNCAKYSRDHYECYNGLDGWQPCSPKLGLTSEGHECSSPCSQKGQPNIKHIRRYSFCYTDSLHQKWGYCSNKRGNVLPTPGSPGGDQRYQSILHVEPPVLSWGRWHHLEKCPNDTIVTGFELKSQMYMGRRYSVIGLLDTITSLGSSPLNDDTDLNGIGLLCTPKSHQQVNTTNKKLVNTDLDHSSSNKVMGHVRRIRSGFGNLGEWGPDFYCRNFAPAIGFKLKVETPQGASDDSGATNFNLVCHDQNDIPDPSLDHEPGEWSQVQKCPKGQALCGIKTKVYDDGGNEDWVGLTDVIIHCCPLMDPMTCEPKEKFETIFTFRNEFNISQKHSKEVTIGLETSEEKGTGKKVENVVNFEDSVGFGFESRLRGGFEKKIGMSKTTGFDWTHTSSTVWSSQIVDKYDLEIPPKTEGRLLQLVGTCGNFLVRTSHLVAKSRPI